MKKQYTGAILAAGRGSRMVPFSDSWPKPLLPVGNQPLIAHQIEIMKKAGINDIVILVGHKGYEIARCLGDGSAFGVKLRYVEQTSSLGIAHAAGRLESQIRTPFLLFLGDIFFVTNNIEEMFALYEEQGGGAILATKEEHDPDAIRKNYALRLNDEGFVSRVIEKPRHLINTLKGVGLYLFDLSIFDAIRRTPRTAMRDEYEITDAIQVLIQDGYPVRPSNSVIDDINLTTASDLLVCNLMKARGSGSSNMIGKGVKLHEGATLHNCIVGNNASVLHPVNISDSVIFEGTTVDAVTGLHHHILTPEFQVDCEQGLSAAQRGLLQ